MLKIEFALQPSSFVQHVDSLAQGFIIIKGELSVCRSVPTGKSVFLVITVTNLMREIRSWFDIPTARQFSFSDIYGVFGITIIKKGSHLIKLYCRSPSGKLELVSNTTMRDFLLSVWDGVQALQERIVYTGGDLNTADSMSEVKHNIYYDFNSECAVWKDFVQAENHK